MEIRQRVSEIRAEDDWALIRLNSVPDQPGIAATVFEAIAAAEVSVDMILQTASTDHTTDLSFTTKSEEAPAAMATISTIRDQIGSQGIELIGELALVQLVGTGILTDPTCLARLFQALADAGVNILAIGTSEIRISCLIDAPLIDQAVAALNDVFQVD